jgi:hypothetical protein
MNEFTHANIRRNPIMYAIRSGFITMMIPKRIERIERSGIIQTKSYRSFQTSIRAMRSDTKRRNIIPKACIYHSDFSRIG